MVTSGGGSLAHQKVGARDLIKCLQIIEAGIDEGATSTRPALGDAGQAQQGGTLSTQVAGFQHLPKRWVAECIGQIATAHPNFGAKIATDVDNLDERVATQEIDISLEKGG